MSALPKENNTMAGYHRRASLHLLALISVVSGSSAFTGTPRTSTACASRHLGESSRRTASTWDVNPRRSLVQSRLKSRLGETEGTAVEAIGNDQLAAALETNDLARILSHLQYHASAASSLTNAQLRSAFDAVEVATAESDENTVNKRAIEDAAIASASGSGPDVEFRPLDEVRSQMTALYRLLRDEGRLSAFGAAGRPPPASLGIAPPPGVINYPTSGSKIITPTLLGEILGMEMISLTPRPTNLLLYGGGALALLEGFVSLYFGVSFNLLVVCTILLALLDQIVVSGAVFETALRMVRPEMTTRITKHEAGHFLCAYLLGCPVEGVVLSTWAALNDGRFGGRSGAISAGTSYYDLDLSEQISGMKPLTRESIDRYSIIVMGGIAAEAAEFGRADGGAGDEEALVRFLRSLNPRSGNAVSAWTPELIRNQARWGATQAVLLLKEYKPCYDALVDALERGGDLGQCIIAIEEAAAREGLGWMRRPLGTVLEEGDYGKWVPIDEQTMPANGSADIPTNGGTMQANGSSPSTADRTNGVPVYGEDPITSTEEFLEKYRVAMEKKLASIDEELDAMDKNKGE